VAVAVLALTGPGVFVAGAFVVAGFFTEPGAVVAGFAVVFVTFFVAVAGFEDGAGKAFFGGAPSIFFCGWAVLLVVVKVFPALGFGFGGAEYTLGLVTARLPVDFPPLRPRGFCEVCALGTDAFVQSITPFP